MTFTIPDGMARKVFEDKYARTVNGEKESWADVSTRVTAGNKLLFEQQSEPVRRAFEEVVSSFVGKTTFEQSLSSLMNDGILVTAGRHLQHGDNDQLTKSGDRMMNCVTSVTSFLNFWLLMQGCGVGRNYSASVCRVNWDFMPHVRLVLDVSHPDYEGWIEPLHEAKHLYSSESQDVRWFKVEDSAEGWTKVISILETAANAQRHKDKLFIFDFSDVREKGRPIRGMQSRPASGPVPFIRAMMDVVRVKGAGLKPWEQALVIDHYLAQAVLSGGVRRSARIACMPWTESEQDVTRFITCKAGGQYYWSANNSVLVDEDFWRDVNANKSCKARRIFDAVIAASFYDKTGEPAFINVDKLKQKNEGLEYLTAKNYINPIIAQRLDLHPQTYDLLEDTLRAVKKLKFQMIVNPCVTADTVIDTTDGPKKVSDLIGQRFESTFIDPQQNPYGYTFRSEGFYLVGERDCVRVEFDNNVSIECTLNHKFNAHDFPKPIASLGVGSKVRTDTGEVTIVSITPVGKKNVYNCSVQEIHQYKTGGIINYNCGEISLHMAGGYCCIGDINLANLPKDYNLAMQAVITMAQFLLNVNKMSFLYDFEVKRTNRIGIGLIGVHEFAWNQFGLTFHDLLDEKKSIEFWKFLGWMRSGVEAYIGYLAEVDPDFALPHTAFTIKPAGTTAKIMQVTEGWHLPAYEAMVRYVQYRKDDPRVQELISQGYPFKDVSNVIRDTVVIGYPTANNLCKSMSENGVTPTCAGDVTMEQHFKWIALGEKWWLGNEFDNQISYTAKFPSTLDYGTYRKMISDNMPNIKCCSVMPQIDTSAYVYQPETKVTLEEYNRLQSLIQQKQVKEDYDESELACAGGACPIEQNIG